MVTAQAIPITEAGLKGYEVIKNGVNCFTTGPCPSGDPGGAALVEIDADGLAAHQCQRLHVTESSRTIPSRSPDW